MDRLFLDANILFSAAYSEKSLLLALWSLEQTQLVSSNYACEEAKRNLTSSEKCVRLNQLIQSIKICQEHDESIIPVEITLRRKDRPILAAAIGENCDHLITGDFRDFGRFYGKKILGTLITPPSAYLKARLSNLETAQTD